MLPESLVYSQLLMEAKNNNDVLEVISLVGYFRRDAKTTTIEEFISLLLCGGVSFFLFCSQDGHK